jgi:hypothetical protein
MLVDLGNKVRTFLFIRERFIVQEFWRVSMSLLNWTSPPATPHIPAPQIKEVGKQNNKTINLIA